MATIYQVSELAGVSLATVSRVMNDSGRVSESTRKKVMDAMRELDYRPNSIAQSLASNRSNCVGVLLTEIHGPVFAAMLGSIESELRDAGKFTVFAAGHNDAEKEREAIRFLTGRNCDALILHVEALNDDFLIDSSSDDGVPFVVINRRVEGLEDRCIQLDNEKGGYLAAKMMIDLGHTSIAYVSGPLTWGDAGSRLTGHKRALEDAGIEFDRRLMVEGDYHEIGGGRALDTLLERGIPFSAVICANDEMAAGAMESARAHGLRLPEDLSIAGFDNAPLARYLYPKLSTIDYPIADMGRMAARWVLSEVYGHDLPPIQHMFEPEVIERASTVNLEQ